MDDIEAVAVQPPVSPERRFRAVTIIIASIYAPFVALHLLVAYVAVPAFAQMFSDMGGTVPGTTQVLMTLSGIGLLGPLLVLVDVGVFYLMYRLARRYWIGLLFAPILAIFAINSLLVPLLYAPMFSVITLVQ